MELAQSKKPYHSNHFIVYSCQYHPFDMEVFQHNHPEAAHKVRTELMEGILALGGNRFR